MRFLTVHTGQILSIAHTIAVSIQIPAGVGQHESTLNQSQLKTYQKVGRDAICAVVGLEADPCLGWLCRAGILCAHRRDHQSGRTGVPTTNHADTHTSHLVGWHWLHYPCMEHSIAVGCTVSVLGACDMGLSQRSLFCTGQCVQ